MSDIIPQNFITQQATKVIDFSNDTIKCILCSGTYDEAVLRDVKEYYELSAYEITSGNGYTVGGIDVTGTSALTDDTNNRTAYYADNIELLASGGNISNVRFGAMYDITGSNTVVYFFDFESDRDILDGSNLIINTDDTGFIKAYQG